MSVHLVGGGRPGQGPDVYAPFVAEAARRATGAGRPVPRVAVLVVTDGDVPSAGFRDAFETTLAGGGRCETVVTTVEAGSVFDTRVLSEVDGLVVAGGVTPTYQRALAPLVDQVRLLVADGLPYLGYSAGAALAADEALVGGWTIGDVPVCPEPASEGLGEVTTAEGFGLVDLAVDVHAVQWGTLARLVAATEAGLVPGGVAVDEHTALVVGEGALSVVGTGNVWRVEAQHDDDGEVVGVVVGTVAGG